MHSSRRDFLLGNKKLGHDFRIGYLNPRLRVVNLLLGIVFFLSYLLPFLLNASIVKMKAVIIKERGKAALVDIEEQSMRPDYIKIRTVAVAVNPSMNFSARTITLVSANILQPIFTILLALV